MKRSELFTPQLLVLNNLEELNIINQISQGWDNRWTYIKQGGVEVGLWVFTTPRMQFSRVGYDNAIMIESSPPVGSIQLSFVRTEGICNTHNQKLEKYELIIVKGGEETNYLANGANEIFSMVFETDFFSEIFYRYFSEAFESVRSDYRLRIKEESVDTFLLYIEQWFLFFQKADNRRLNIERYFDLEMNIIENLFSLIQMGEQKQDRSRFDIATARHILEANIDNIYTVSTLVEELGISMRTLQYNFKEKLGISPKQYLQYLRLNAIRKELQQAEPQSIKISEVILRYGFFHPSHFTLEYKKLFGETPTETLQ